MKRWALAAVIAVAVMLFCGVAQRPETIMPECEVRSYPAGLLEWIEPAEYMAKTMWGEARGLDKTQQAAVAWCILNRVDAGYGDIIEVVTAPEQFRGYYPANPAEPETVDLALDVIGRWLAEQNGVANVGRVLPEEYIFFSARGGINYFRCEYYGAEWTWEAESPYKEG